MYRLGLHGSTLITQFRQSCCKRNAPKQFPWTACRAATTAARQSFKPSAAGRDPKPALRPGPVQRAAYNPVAQQLAQRSAPVLLYQGETKVPYTTGCILLGGLLTLYAFVNGANVLDPRAAVGPIMLGGFAVVCVGMQGIGLFMFTKVLRIVSSVFAVPKVLPNGRRALMLRVDSGVFRSKYLEVPCEDVSLSERLFTSPVRQSGLQKLVESRRRKEKQQWQRERIMTLPFRQAAYWSWRAFRAFQRVFTDEGWIKLRIKGRRGYWKLHQRPAWALRDGRVLDDIVRH